MKHLFCPWRSGYSKDNGRSKQEDTTADECVFCIQVNEKHDEQNLILKRYKYHVVMLNKYPYNAGHLLILPYAHISKLQELSPEAQHELIELTALCTDAMQKGLQAQGVNIGMNLGKIAGAGIPSHLHMHVLPRYSGDTSFMSTLANTKNISFDLAQMYRQIKAFL